MSPLARFREMLGIRQTEAAVVDRRVTEERRRITRPAADRRACFGTDWLDGEAARRAELALRLNAQAGD